jgi:hypothetical protein
MATMPLRDALGDVRLAVRAVGGGVCLSLAGAEVVLRLDQARELEQRLLAALPAAELSELGTRPRRVPLFTSGR